MTNPSEVKASPSHGDKAVRGLRQIALSRIFTQLVTWGLTAVTIHLLHPRDYGVIATAGIFTSFAQMLLDSGLSDVLVAQQNLSEEIQRAAATWVFFVSSIVGAVIFIGAPVGSRFFHESQLKLVIEVSAFYLPLISLEVVPLATLSKRMQFKSIALAQTISSILTGFTALALAYGGAGYWALIAGNFVGAAARVILLWLSLDKKPRPTLHFAPLKPLIQSSIHMLGQRLAYFSISNGDIFLLGRFAGPAQLGEYSVSRTLSYSALNQISAIVNQVSVPVFAAKTDAGSQVRGLIFVVSIASAVLFPLFWIMGVASQVALPLVLGARWKHLVLPFLAFTAVLPLRGVNTLLYSSIIGTGRTGTVFKNTLTFAAIILPAMAIGVTKGADGVALSWVLALPIIFYIGVHRIAKDLGTQMTLLLRPMVLPALCGALSAAAAEAALLILSGLLSSPIVLATQCVVATLCYWGLFRLLARNQYDQAVTIMRRLARG